MSSNIAIAWKNLSVVVNTLFTEPNKLILSDISGDFQFQALNALMGCSGSGKTTLLKCLNASNKYRISNESKIWVSKVEEIRKGFIYQDHETRIMADLNVGHALVYASKLNNENEKGVNHHVMASRVAKELMITDIIDNRIDKCSSGQIKRICIGLELMKVQKPNLFFIDEPTTGLDSNAATLVCTRNLTFN